MRGSTGTFAAANWTTKQVSHRFFVLRIIHEVEKILLRSQPEIRAIRAKHSVDGVPSFFELILMLLHLIQKITRLIRQLNNFFFDFFLSCF